ncbi:MAG: SUMF1/EgtB/PvdO family nonheme iron enzyme [Akkermansiaceae bacterium]|nr:SUMF1/EgtB/PvdO family nonheme iron enzyme [Akkermansiaceae bacterium]
MCRLLFLLLSLSLCLQTLAAPPVITNVRASQRPGTKLVDIYYDLSDADGDLQEIRVQVSGDGGLTYTIPASTFTGAYGLGVSLGVNRHVVWNAGADWDGNFMDTTKVRVTAFDGTTPPAPPGMAYIPPGQFQMGDTFQEGDSDERPLHMVTVSGFFMELKEVTYQLWSDVSTWSRLHGYNFSGPQGAALQPEQAVTSLSWYSAVRWCNARSEMEGLEPVYYLDASLTEIMRSQSGSIWHAHMHPTANGYRLPTEAEWERAARGGLHGKRYPNGNSIALDDENFLGSGDPWESFDPPVSPPAQYAPNGFGIFDLGGNVSEHCFDLYGSDFYGSDENIDPTGPSTASVKINNSGSRAHVARGGNFRGAPDSARVAGRFWTDSPNWSEFVGLRCARSVAPNP